MKHNISITMEQTIFREIENARLREKRSTFIEHLIIIGLKTYRNEKAKQESINNKTDQLQQLSQQPFLGIKSKNVKM